MQLKLISLSVVLIVLKEVYSHGMVLEPINRSSIWRVNSSFPENYEDNQNFCGGFGVNSFLYDVNLL